MKIISKLNKQEDFSLRHKWRKGVVFIALVLLIAVFSILSDRFMTIQNMEVIGRQVAILSILSFGMTFVITTGGIDLSVGANMAISGIIAGLTIQIGAGVLLATCAGLATGLVIGLVNGIIVAKVKIPAFLVTLGTMSMARGAALAMTGTMPVTLLSTKFGKIWGSGTLFGIPAIIWWAVFLFLISFVVYKYIPFGNYVKSVGGNETAAKYTGVNVDKIKIYVYMISGIFCGFAALLMLSRLGTARPEVGENIALDAITAVIIGGTSLFGGKGSIANTLIGALILTIITNALVILGVDVNIQQIIKGAIVIAAVSLSEKT